MFKYWKYFLLTSTHWSLISNDDILVGGQAVIEGVMMRSPRGYSVAVRRQDGAVSVLKAALKTVGEKRPFLKLPIFRGVAILGQSLVLGIKALRFSAEEALRDLEGPKAEPRSSGSSLLIGANLALALAVNVALFVVLPLFLTRLIQNFLGFQGSLVFDAVDGLFRILIFLAFIYSVSFMRDMRRVFEYHGAEHKTVYTFEGGQELKVENARKYSTLHPRCGTSFLLVVMIVSIFIFSLASFDSFAGKLLSRIALLPLIAGTSYEIIRYSAKHPRSMLRWVTLPGLMLQKITTREPDDTQLEIAVRALEEALTV